MFIVNWQAGTEWWQDVAPTMMTHRHTVTHLCYARLCPALTSLSAHTDGRLSNIEIRNILESYGVLGGLNLLHLIYFSVLNQNLHQK